MATEITIQGRYVISSKNDPAGVRVAYRNGDSLEAVKIYMHFRQYADMGHDIHNWIVYGDKP